MHSSAVALARCSTVLGLSICTLSHCRVVTNHYRFVHHTLVAPEGLNSIYFYFYLCPSGVNFTKATLDFCCHYCVNTSLIAFIKNFKFLKVAILRFLLIRTWNQRIENGIIYSRKRITLSRKHTSQLLNIYYIFIYLYCSYKES